MSDGIRKAQFSLGSSLIALAVAAQPVVHGRTGRAVTKTGSRMDGRHPGALRTGRIAEEGPELYVSLLRLTFKLPRCSSVENSVCLWWKLQFPLEQVCTILQPLYMRHQYSCNLSIHVSIHSCIALYNIV